MQKVLTLSRCANPDTELGGVTKTVMRMSLWACVVSICASCVTTLPAGDSADISVAQVQLGNVEKGMPVRWGGTITKIHNKADLTVLEIVSRPLHRSGRPKHNDVTDGRFFAEISGFVDPEIAGPGRDISVIGTIERVEDGLVGEAEYRYPVMRVFDHQVWDKSSDINTRDYDPYYPYYPYSGGYWPYRGRSGIHGRLHF